MCYTNNVNKKWKKGWHKYIKSIIIEKRKADKTMGFFDKLTNGLNKTKTSFDEKINIVFKNFRKVDEEFLDELEEVLIMSDIGMETSIKIISNLREKIKKEKIQDEEEVKQALREEMQKILDVTDIELHLNTKPSVILVVGVNGVGKTTSIDSTSKDIAKKSIRLLLYKWIKYCEGN